MSGLLTALGRVLPAATSVKTLGLTIELPIVLGIGAVIEGPALVHWWLHRHDPAPLSAPAETKLTNAGAAIAADAVARQASHDAAIARIDTTTQEGESHVLTTNGAGDHAPGVAASLHDALCLSDAYAAEPDCAAVRGDRAGLGAAAPDAGRAPAGGR